MKCPYCNHWNTVHKAFTNTSYIHNRKCLGCNKIFNTVEYNDKQLKELKEKAKQYKTNVIKIDTEKLAKQIVKEIAKKLQ